MARLAKNGCRFCVSIMVESEDDRLGMSDARLSKVGKGSPLFPHSSGPSGKRDVKGYRSKKIKTTTRVVRLELQAGNCPKRTLKIGMSLTN